MHAQLIRMNWDGYTVSGMKIQIYCNCDIGRKYQIFLQTYNFWL